MNKTFFLASAAALLAGVSTASAGIIWNGGTGGTSYGATQYNCPGAPGPCSGGRQYISNNFTGDFDILSTPGGGYQVANPVLGNNIASTGIINAPYTFGWNGGVSGDGSAFGSGNTRNNGPSAGFSLTDSAPGGGSASYMITSMLNTFTVTAGGFNGRIGDYLSIAGTNNFGNDASVASLRGKFNINGGGFFALPDLMLALGGGCNNQVAGSAVAFRNAACANGGNGGRFSGLAIGNGGVLNLLAGTVLNVVTTITVYADPSSIDSLASDDPLFASLLADTGSTLPDLSVGDSGSLAPAPEPGTWAILGGSLLAMGIARRKRA